MDELDIDNVKERITIDIDGDTWTLKEVDCPHCDYTGDNVSVSEGGQSETWNCPKCRETILHGGDYAELFIFPGGPAPRELGDE